MEFYTIVKEKFEKVSLGDDEGENVLQEASCYQVRSERHKGKYENGVKRRDNKSSAVRKIEPEEILVLQGKFAGILVPHSFSSDTRGKACRRGTKIIFTEVSAEDDENFCMDGFDLKDDEKSSWDYTVYTLEEKK